MSAISCAIDWPGTLTFIRDILVSVATVVTVVLACRGFSTWRDVELGKADLELARRLLTTVFRTRDWYATARRPMIMSGEFPEGFLPDATGQKKHDAYWHMFNNRFKPVQENCVELQPLKCEAEALWGPEVVTRIDRLLMCCRKLQTAMEVTLNIYASSGSPERLEQSARQFDKQLYDSGREITLDGTEGTENPHTAEMRLAVDEIEQHVRGKLMQKPTVRNANL
jgi:hypothetical protein